MTTKRTDSTVEPFRRPPRVDPVARMQRGLHGLCYEYAFKEALRYSQAGSPAPAMHIVHGVYKDMIEHAWVERGGFAYDWQSLVMGGDPLPLAQFYERQRARKLTVYTVKEAIAETLRSGHTGPWTTAAQDAIRAFAEARGRAIMQDESGGTA